MEGKMEDYDVTNLKSSIYKIKPRTGTATRPDNIEFNLAKENEEFKIKVGCLKWLFI